MFCLSKGLGAPVGSVLCGTRPSSTRRACTARASAGGMRQAGVIAAAGIVALETMVERLADDHARARTLADALAELFPGSVDPDRGRDQHRVRARRRAARRICSTRSPADGVLAGTIDVDTVRFVTHHDVDDAGLARAVAALRRIACANCAAAPDHYRGGHGRVRRDARPRAGRATPTPTIPRSRPGARWPSGRRRAARCGCSSRPAATRAPRIPTPISTRSPRCGSRRRPRRRRCSASPAHLHLDYPDGELPDDQELRGAIARVIRERRARGRALPRPDRGVLRRRLLQPPRPPRHRLGDARRGGAGRGQPALLPRAHRRGARGAPRARGLPVGHARAELLDRHRRHARAQDRRAVLPRQPARRRGRVVPRVPARARRGRRRRRRHDATPSRSVGSPSAPDPPLRLDRRARSGRRVLAAPLGHGPEHEHRDDADTGRRRSASR